MADNESLVKKVEQYEKEQQQPNPEKKKKQTRKIVFNIIFVFALTALSIYLTVYGNFNRIVENLSNIFLCKNGCHWKYLLAIVAIMALAVFLRSLVLFFFARLYTRKYHLHQAIAVDQIGIFYSAVTPGSSGGQIMQAYTYKKQGIPISSAVSMLAMYSIMFQIVLILYGTVSFIVKYDVINSIGAVPLNFGFGEFDLPIWPLTIIGFMLNVGVIGLVLLMGYWKGFHNFIMGPVISFLHKIRLNKHPDKTRESLRIQVENFKIEMRRIYSNIPFALLICVIFAFYITVKYSAPYFVGKALGNQSECATLFDSVFLSNYHQMVTGLIPIPGSAGVSELFFKLLFVSKNPTPTNSFYYAVGDGSAAGIKKASESLASSALLVWRSMMFIIPLIIAGFVTAFYHASPKEEMRKDGDLPNRATFVSLQATTYETRKEELETMVETSRLTRQEVMKRLRNYRKHSDKKKKETPPDNSTKEKPIDDVSINVEDDSL